MRPTFTTVDKGLATLWWKLHLRHPKKQRRKHHVALQKAGALA